MLKSASKRQGAPRFSGQDQKNLASGAGVEDRLDENAEAILATASIKKNPDWSFFARDTALFVKRQLALNFKEEKK